jgi:phage terminase large subunit GpA-like protein
MGRPDDPDVWEQLDDIIDKVYYFESGVGLKISMTFVDEGGHFTQEVRYQCRERLNKKVFAIKGRGGDGIPYTSPPKKQKIIIKGRSVGTCWQYVIGVDAGKQIIMDNLRVQTPGSRYCHFPRRDDYGPAYFRSLLSERLVYRPERKNPWVWEKIPGHERNEALDCRNYALAAFKALPLDLDAIERRLIEAKKAREQGAVETTLTRQPVKRTRQRRKGSSTLNRYYDDW